MGSLVYPCCCCCCYFRAAVKCMHWAALTSWKASLLKNGQCDVCTGRRPPAKETGFGSLPDLLTGNERSGVNRIGHPDRVKLSVELNCAPNQNTDFPFHYTLHLGVEAIEKGAFWFPSTTVSNFTYLLYIYIRIFWFYIFCTVGSL